MKKKLLLFVAAVGLGACEDSVTSTPTVVPDPITPNLAVTDEVPRPGHHIVVFDANVADPGALAQAIVSAHDGTLEYTYSHAIKGFAAELSDAAVASLRYHPDIARIEEDSYMHAVGTQTGATWGLDRLD